MSDDHESATPVVVEEVDTSPVVARSKILVVDDTPANLVAAEAALAPLARHVVTALSGDEALAHLLDQEFALALIDVNMPDMNGLELAQLIRARERTQHLPIIFMTAHSQDEASVLHAYDLGAVDFLFRPVIPQVLRAKASVFVMLQERNEQLAAERLEREFENRRRDYEAAGLRRERDHEQAAKLELSRLNDALAEHDRRKDSFIAILAHELRNPLATLRTSIDLFRANPAQSPTGVIDALERQTGTLVRLVDDLLDVSRIKADKIELRPEPIDLADAVNAAIATCRAAIDARRHALVVNAPATRTMVMGDLVRVTQIITNLVSNATRYTNRDGHIAITVGTAGELGFVRVADDGVGIPAELQHTIFEMFVQERVRSDGSGGLGLGLALAKRLVEMHNGTIAATSPGRDRGSVFEIQIPRVGSPRALPMRRRTREMQPLRSDLAGTRSIRMLVIDDNDDARELLSELLRRRGCEVLTADDGPAGVQLLREQQPDVALVDIGLPTLDGFGVIETALRECPELKTRLVALTGYGQSADQERTRRAGFHAHLVKPATAEAILACLSEQLGAAI